MGFRNSSFTPIFKNNAPIAKWTKAAGCNPVIGGSNPSRSFKFPWQKAKWMSCLIVNQVIAGPSPVCHAINFCRCGDCGQHVWLKPRRSPFDSDRRHQISFSFINIELHTALGKSGEAACLIHK